MAKQRTPLEHAAGKLISALQKEWHDELGEPCASVSEAVVHNSHALLQGAKDGSVHDLLRSGTVTDFIGRAWVLVHPRVLPAIRAFEEQVALSRGGSPTSGR